MIGRCTFEVRPQRQESNDSSAVLVVCLVPRCAYGLRDSPAFAKATCTAGGTWNRLESTCCHPTPRMCTVESADWDCSACANPTSANLAVPPPNRTFGDLICSRPTACWVRIATREKWQHVQHRKYEQHLKVFNNTSSCIASRICYHAHMHAGAQFF